MSSFNLLDDFDSEEIVAVKTRNKRKSKTKKQQLDPILAPIVLMDTVLHNIFIFLDVKTIYNKAILIDVRMKDLICGRHFCHSVLNREFNALINGEEEEDHKPLLDFYCGKSAPAHFGLEPMSNLLQRIDPSNVFGLWKEKWATDNYPSSEIQPLFVSIFEKLNQRRTTIANRNMRIRSRFIHCIPTGGKSYDIERSKIWGRQVVGTDTESSYSHVTYHGTRADRSILECDHFAFKVLQANPLTVECKSCGHSASIIYHTNIFTSK